MCLACLTTAVFIYGTVYLMLLIGFICYYYNYKKIGLCLIIPSATILLFDKVNRAQKNSNII